MRSDTLNNYKKWCILVNLYMCENNHAVPIRKLARESENSVTNPYFKEVFDQLMNDNIAIVQETDGITKYVILDKKELLKLIEQSEIWDFFVTFTNVKTGGFYKVV